VLVEEVRDPEAFLDAARSFLLEDEARNNLILGIAGTLRDQPSLFGEHRLWLIQDGNRAVGAALRTPPYNLVLAGPARAAALEHLAESLRAAGEELPGVTGAVPEVDEFAAAWEARADVVRKRRMAQRIYRLTAVRPVEGVRGRARMATEEDRPLLVAWADAFAAEVVPEGSPGQESERAVDARLHSSAGGFAFWEDDGPVSLVGWGGQTPNGIRIGPVYTPPEHRGRGYGSSVTAAVSAEQLGSGRTFCFLYTDLANPTSNRIYTNIGYEPVCDSIDYAFTPR
jgi:hypothetical protein